MKKVCGVGINDIKNSNKQKFKRVWASMLERAYSTIWASKHPTYNNVTVCDDWHVLSSFKTWFDMHYVDGWQLDKDLIDPDSKIYSPETCAFVPQYLNKLETDSAGIRGEYPKGVHFHKKAQKYKAQITVDNKPVHLGLFDTVDDAHDAYQIAKSEHVLNVVIPRAIADGVDSRVIESLRSRY
ncbi:hypothetical protein [Vibrio phage TCU_VP02_YC]